MPTATSMPNLFTRDIDAALGFYRDRLGFAQSFRMPSDGRPEHVVLSLDDARLALSTDRAVAETGLQPSA
ncbi:MAG: VOC family protein, partial [Gammaproteobacteria bacterium]